MSDLSLHIDVSRLLQGAEGAIVFLSAEREHLHECSTCNDIFAIFVTGRIDNPRPPKRASADSAA